MSNIDIICGELEMRGLDPITTVVYTYAEWRYRGYQVKKGEKAFIETHLWKPVKEKKEAAAAEDNGNGKEKKNRMILVKAYLFNQDQVKKIEKK